jgi:hypothetical protein
MDTADKNFFALKNLLNLSLIKFPIAIVKLI